MVGESVMCCVECAMWARLSGLIEISLVLSRIEMLPPPVHVRRIVGVQHVGGGWMEGPGDGPALSTAPTPLWRTEADDGTVSHVERSFEETG